MKNNRFIIKRKSGFSLVELLTVIALMAIVAAIAIPNFLVWRANYRFRNAMADLYSSLQQTRMLAMKERMSYTMTFKRQIGTETYDYIIFRDNNRNRIYETSGTTPDVLIKKVKLSEYIDVELLEVDLILNGNNLESVSYLTSGMRMSPAIDSHPGQILLRNTKSKAMRQINISKAGGLSITNVK